MCLIKASRRDGCGKRWRLCGTPSCISAPGLYSDLAKKTLSVLIARDARDGEPRPIDAEVHGGLRRVPVDRSTRRDDRATERVDRATRRITRSAEGVDRAAAPVDRPRPTADRPLMPE